MLHLVVVWKIILLQNLLVDLLDATPGGSLKNYSTPVSVSGLD